MRKYFIGLMAGWMFFYWTTGLPLLVQIIFTIIFTIAMAWLTVQIDKAEGN